jgi:hypothetical protein
MSFFFTLFIYAVLFVLSDLLRTKPDLENAKPAGLGDFSFPTATEGRVVPLFWGTTQFSGPNVVWYGNLIQEAITDKIKTGMFSSKKVTTGYKYHIGVQYAFGRGGDDSRIRRIWIADDIVWSGTVVHEGTLTIDKPKLFGGNKLGNGGVVGTLQFFDGRSTQVASSYLSTYQKQGGDTPAYRGVTYLAPYIDPTYLGNSTSIKTWKFEIDRFPNGLALGSGKHIVNSADANPMNVLYELMTNTEWGLGYDVADIDTTNLSDAANTLYDEGNGFSMQIERAMQASELLKLLEAQVDGVVFQNQLTGKWQINLARDDYTPGTLREITNAKVKNFARGSWEDTTNQVRVPFFKRADSYKKTYGIAQDMSNVAIQNGVTVTASVNHPGVKDATLANTLAWRDLRSLSYPLAKGTLEVDRTFYDVQPAEVLEFTDANLNFDRLPIRMRRIDLGELENNKVILHFVQDIYAFEQGSFDDPPDTGWEPPEDDLNPFDADKQVCFEAPRALVSRNPEGGGLIDLLWAAARKKGVEVAFKMAERHSSGTPSGPFTEIAEIYDFMYIGSLSGDLDAGSATPLSTLIITASPDSQVNIEGAIQDLIDLAQLGTDLTNVILIDDEFMMPQSAQTSGPDIQLNNIYRAVFDSVQDDHASGAKVYIVSYGGGLSETALPAGQNVDVELLPFSLSDEVASGVPTIIQFTMADRIRKPYPPSFIKLNTVLWDATSVSFEYAGSDPEDYGITLLMNRRDYRTADGGDEVAAIVNDASTIFGDFPSFNSTNYDIQVRNDPDGSDTLLFTENISGASIDILRLKILKETDGVIPSKMRFVITAKHTYESVAYDALQDLYWDFTIATALTGDFNFSALDTSDISNIYTVDQAGVHNFVLSSAFTAGDIEYRVNSGSWVQLVAAASTTGATTSLSVSDTLEVRHLSNDTDALKQLTMTAPGGGTDGYAILFT